MKSIESTISFFNKDETTTSWKYLQTNSTSLDTTIHNGMAISLAGQLWDKKLDGRTLIIQNGVSTVIPTNTTGRIINLWVN